MKTPDHQAEMLLIEAQDKISSAQALKPSAEVALVLQRINLAVCDGVSEIAEAIAQPKP